MDFFGILFDMKNGKKVPYSKTYFDTLFAAKLAEMQVKTITGTLPLTFTTSETALRSWTIHGNNTPHNYSAEGTLPLTFTTHTAGNADDWIVSGNSNIGKNLLEITAETQTILGVTFTVDKQAGTITANGIATAEASFGCWVTLPAGRYLENGCPSGGSDNSYDVYMWNTATNTRTKKWDGETYTPSDYGRGVSQEVLLTEETQVRYTCRIRNGYNAQNVVFKPMLRLPDASADFEPYQVGVGQRTANLFNINASTLVPINASEYRFGVSLGKLDAGDYVLSFVNSSTYTLYITKRTGTSYTQSSTISTSPFTFSVSDSVNEVYLRTTRQQGGTPSTWADLGFTDIIINAGSTAPSSYVPYGYEVPISTQGKNLVPPIRTANGWKQGYRQKTNGNYTTTHNAGEWLYDVYVPIDSTSFTFWATAVSGAAGGTFYFFDNNKDYLTNTAIDINNYNNVTISNLPSNAVYMQFAFRTYCMSEQEIIDNNYQVMLVKGSTAPQTYIPYFHNDYTFYIGSTPLTAGQSVSKTSTGVDIAAIAGTNTITTDLYNKPEMAITGVDYIGVGEYVNGQWQIPLTVTCDRNLFNIYGNMAYSGGVHLIDYNVETSSVTGEMPANSFFQLGVQNAIVKGDETFVISFDKTTAGTAEMRMMNGTGSSAEIIETFDISAAKSYRVVFECEESFGNVYPRLVATEAATQTFEHIMIKKASNKGGFVPYGAHTDYTIPIDAPLTEGQSVSDTVEITAYEGTNTLDTTLTVRPDATITYK